MKLPLLIQIRDEPTKSATKNKSDSTNMMARLCDMKKSADVFIQTTKGRISQEENQVSTTLEKALKYAKEKGVEKQEMTNSQRKVISVANTSDTSVAGLNDIKDIVNGSTKNNHQSLNLDNVTEKNLIKSTHISNPRKRECPDSLGTIQANFAQKQSDLLARQNEYNLPSKKRKFSEPMQNSFKVPIFKINDANQHKIGSDKNKNCMSNGDHSPEVDRNLNETNKKFGENNKVSNEANKVPLSSGTQIPFPKSTHRKSEVQKIQSQAIVRKDSSALANQDINVNNHSSTFVPSWVKFRTKSFIEKYEKVSNEKIKGKGQFNSLKPKDFISSFEKFIYGAPCSNRRQVKLVI